MTEQCWCGYDKSEHTNEMRQWAYENDQPSPCLFFKLWPEQD